jgi:hypothetical protein
MTTHFNAIAHLASMEIIVKFKPLHVIKFSVKMAANAFWAADRILHVIVNQAFTAIFANINISMYAAAITPILA